MAKIFDNITSDLLPALQQSLKVAERSDFCVGYFNLRGWQLVDDGVEVFSGGDEHCCRLIVGMQRLPQDELRDILGGGKPAVLDQGKIARLKRAVLHDFRQQLTIGLPTGKDEGALRRLIAQLRAKKLVVKLYLRQQLHAKLYLFFGPQLPVGLGYVGSSNLTFSGLGRNAELNLDVLGKKEQGDVDEKSDVEKLADWFNDRWKDDWCLPINDELIQILEESWARSVPLPPYHIYVKMAWHLCSEAREGIREFRLPPMLEDELFDFQKKAVQIAAQKVHRRDGVILGDVVGLGKTLMATALARLFEDEGMDALIICPANLVEMWEDYRKRYGLRGQVMSVGKVQKQLPTLWRYRLVILDESHNQRNRESKRYQAIFQYIQRNDSKCILLSATPYNKTYLDLSNQLRLFLAEDKPLNVRPNRLLKDFSPDPTTAEVEFHRKHQSQSNTLAAFEHGNYPEDWRELMKLYMVRRTRSFIMKHYAETDPKTGRPALKWHDGSFKPFPEREPKTVKFTINDADPTDQYARLYSDAVVQAINDLNLPRYGLGLDIYRVKKPSPAPTKEEAKILDNLSRAGQRLKGFCRTNLFKRLESTGFAFLVSVERHALRNFIFLHAIEHNLPLPIGTQTADLLDPLVEDEDADDLAAQTEFDDDDSDDAATETSTGEDAVGIYRPMRTEPEFRQRAAEVYQSYSGQHKKRFKWISPHLFSKALPTNLLRDARILIKLLLESGDWDAARDAKLTELADLLVAKHPKAKVLIFSQFADSIRYLARNLKARGLTRLAGVTGNNAHPTAFAWQFSPVSNRKRDKISPKDELRVLLATDVLSEGQNLQDCAIIVNFDLPWAIIRLIQRAGRVDRIGQEAAKILAYTFLPADGVDRIIRLRGRLRQRLSENAEVVGTDEVFFEGDDGKPTLLDLYHEKAGILNGESDTEIDLVSYAYQIWKNAITADPSLEKSIPLLPNVVYSAKELRTPPAAIETKPAQESPPGVLVFTRTNDGNDYLSWLNSDAKPVTDSQFAILDAAACKPETPAAERAENHHDLVQQAVELSAQASKNPGGQLGSPRGARFRAYAALNDYLQRNKGTLFGQPAMEREIQDAMQDIYKFPLRSAASEILKSHFRLGAKEDAIAELILNLRREDQLCQVREETDTTPPPQLICSLGLRPPPAK